MWDKSRWRQLPQISGQGCPFKGVLFGFWFGQSSGEQSRYFKQTTTGIISMGIYFESAEARRDVIADEADSAEIAVLAQSSGI